MKTSDAPIRMHLFHDAHLMILLFLFFIAITLPFKWHTVTTWAFIFCVIGLLQKRFFKFAFQTLALAFALATTTWLLNILFHNKNISVHEVLINANKTALKIWALTWVSLLSSKMVNIRDVIIFLLQRRWMSNQIAYAIMVGLNAINLLSKEAKRINLNAKLRGIKGRQRFSQWIPLLIFSLRHAQRGAMSLRARKLSNSKTFYYNYQATSKQIQTSMLIVSIFLVLTLVNEYRWLPL